jgi:hypothetical protein
MFILHHQNATQNHNINIAKKSFENVEKFNTIFGYDSDESKLCGI